MARRPAAVYGAALQNRWGAEKMWWRRNEIQVAKFITLFTRNMPHTGHASDMTSAAKQA